jgi:sigma-B regulation protein RsbU (phosphoserine phosphatase)
LRADLPDFALGAVFAFVGAAALVLRALKVREPSLLAFGAFTLLYGVRLLARTAYVALLGEAPPCFWRTVEIFVTYAILVPAFSFFELILGPGWRSSLTRVRQLVTLYAAGAIAVDVATGVPGAALGPNSFVVFGAGLVGVANAFLGGAPPGPDLGVVRAGIVVFGVLALNENLVGAGLVPWRVQVEAVGMAALLCCLGYTAVARAYRNARRLASIEQELATARRIQSSILPDRLPLLHGGTVGARYAPMAAVAGDLYDFLEVDRHRLGILVADVTGHGVPAALVAAMVKMAVTAQAPHAARPDRVLAGLNRSLQGRPLVTAAYVYLDLEAGRLLHSSAGHPPALLWRAAEGRAREIGANGMLLGLLPKAEYPVTEERLASGDRVLLFTDGITEARRPDGEFYEIARLRSFLEAHASVPAQALADSVLDELTRWTGRATPAFDDDATIVALGVG